jgi:dienelactone hydrolase
MKLVKQFLCGAWIVAILFSSLVYANESEKLKNELTPILDTLRSETQPFSVTGSASLPIDGKLQKISLRYVRYSMDCFDLEVTHADYAIQLLRRETTTTFLLPKHKVAFVGTGELDKTDHLQLNGILNRLISARTEVAVIKPLLQGLDGDAIAFALSSLLKLSATESTNTWRVDDVEVHIVGAQGLIDAKSKDVDVQLQISSNETATPPTLSIPADYRTENIPRAQLERQFVRGVRRAMEILAPGLQTPSEKSRTVPNGELRWIDHQRVVLLHGSPEQVGTAHGKLLKNECQSCIDSVLYTFGLAQTIQSGQWFPNELHKAYQRLSPHIPERHKVETRALAASIGQEPELLETINVFPELFHCSGFAIYGKATVDGTLYHGRVLDYMTAIGLQDAATTFIVSVDGQIPFANVGYAGFIGSVSGMNARKISLGEMGGRGEGKWDGVPMATLMRRALEECDSLDKVIELWQKSPRTCEYYYVFADGNNKSAVGVAATPEKLELVRPGQSHDMLGAGIEDCVVLSAGSRLELLRKRVTEGYGKFDEQSAIDLMDRPVAMESNLHNVLFVPEKGLLYVANASHKEPAANRPYSKLDLNELLADKTIARTVVDDKAPTSSPTTITATDKPAFGATFSSRDSLNTGIDPSPDATECLDGLCWKPESFSVSYKQPWEAHGDALIEFPSPLANGHKTNDQVSMEWYQVKNKTGDLIKAPAVVVVHESGSGMVVGRLIAQQLNALGLHTFMIHLPYYGPRRGEGGKPTGKELFTTIRQAIADVRRARDAVAVMPAVESSNISLQGTSLGGFVSATSGALDDGYQAVFITLAGGGLYDVIKNGERDAANLRHELERNQVTDQQLQTLLNTIEPLRLAHRLDPKRTWVYSGRFDNVVPPSSSLRLVESANLAKDHHIEMLADHYSGIVFLPFILNHMKNRVRELPSVAQ